MSGSLEVRNFLSQHDLNGSSFMAGVPAQRTGDTPRVSEEQVHRARLSVARSAIDVDDCRILLDMLGLIDGEDGVPPVCR